MAFTKVVGAGIHTLSNIASHNINSSGIITATKFVGPMEGDITAVDGTFTGNVTIGGTLTYEDVKNVDSVGIITARQGIRVPDGGDSSNRISVGDSEDLKIYHTGNTSTIKHNNGSGDLIIDALATGSDIRLRSEAEFNVSVGGNTHIQVYKNGGVSFNQAGTGAGKKLETMSSGARVTGTLDVTSGITLDDSITHSGDTNTKIRFPAADTFTVETAGTERVRIDSSGAILMGGTSSRDIGFPHKLQLEDNDTNPKGLSIISNRNTVHASHIDFAKTRGTSLGSNTIVQDGDYLGHINFRGADGTDLATPASRITASVDGTPGSNNIPGNLTFWTQTAGGSITERLRIDSSGRVLIGTTTPTSLADDLIVATSGDCGITIMSGTTHNGRLYFSDSGQEGDGFVDYDHQFGNLKLGTRDITRFTIDSSGRVLIGTGTVGETSADDLTIETSGNTGIAIRSGTSNAGNIHFSDGTSGADQYRGIIQYHHNDNSMKFFTNATEKLRITSGGEVTIGTSNPTTFRYVGTGHPYNNNNYTVHGFSNIGLVGQYSSLNMPFDHSTATTSGAWWMLGRSSGISNEWGLYTRSGNLSNLLSVWKVVGSSNGHVSYQSFSTGASSEVLRITSGGFVGIGVTNPEDYDSGAKNLVVGSSGQEGITIRSSSPNTGNLQFSDGATKIAGISFKHDSTASNRYFSFLIDNGSSYVENLRIQDGKLIFSNDQNSYISGGSDVFRFTTGGTERVRINASGHLKLPDSAELQFGGALHTGNGDLRIYHQGSHSYIQDAGTGALILVGSQIVMQNAAQSENIFSATENGSVDLYHNGNIRAYTAADGFALSRVNTFPNPNNTGSEITGAMLDIGGNLHLEERYPAGAYADRQDLVFRFNTGYGQGFTDKFRFTSGGKLELQVDGGGIKFPNTQTPTSQDTSRVGISSEMRYYETGTTTPNITSTVLNSLQIPAFTDNSYVRRICRYVRVGHLVFCNVEIKMASTVTYYQAGISDATAPPCITGCFPFRYSYTPEVHPEINPVSIYYTGSTLTNDTLYAHARKDFPGPPFIQIGKPTTNGVGAHNSSNMGEIFAANNHIVCSFCYPIDTDNADY